MFPVDPAHPPQGFKPGRFMVFIGGGNGSGKTVVNELLLRQLVEEGYNKNYIAKLGSGVVDDILSNGLVQLGRIKLEEYLHSAASSKSVSDQQKMSFLKRMILRAFITVRDRAIKTGAPIVIDYHMHDKKFVEDCVAAARENGYQCIMITPHVDEERIIPRLQKRLKEKRRPFEVNDVFERHRQFAENLDDYLRLFDLSIILDNNKDNAPPSIIAISHSGNTIVYNEDAYAKVRGKAQLSSAATSALNLRETDTEKRIENRSGSESAGVGIGFRENSGAAEKNTDPGYFVRMIEGDFRAALSLKSDPAPKRSQRS